MSLVLGPALIKTTHRSRENVTETIEATGKTCTLHLACPTTLASLHPSNLCLVITTLILCGSDSKLSAAAIYLPSWMERASAQHVLLLCASNSDSDWLLQADHFWRMRTRFGGGCTALDSPIPYVRLAGQSILKGLGLVN